MPELRVGYSDTHKERLASLMELFGIAEKSRFAEFLIDALWMQSTLNSTSRGIKERAARVLSVQGKWVQPLTYKQIARVSIGDSVAIYIEGIGEPYRLTLQQWDEG